MTLLYSFDHVFMTALTIAGLVSTVLLRRRLGPAFVLVLLGFGLELAYEIARYLTSTWPHSIAADVIAHRTTFTEVLTLSGRLHWADTAVTITSLTLLAAAITAGRQPQEPAPPAPTRPQ